MNRANEVRSSQMGVFRDEDLERAIKLSLNPDEQTSKEQQEYVIACKESLIGNESNPIEEDEIIKKLPLPLCLNSINTVPCSSAKITNDEKGIAPIYNSSPTKKIDNNILSSYKYSIEDESINIELEDNEDNVERIPVNINSAESICDIKSVKTNTIDNITDMVNATGIISEKSDILMIDTQNENKLGYSFIDFLHI